MTGMKRGVEFTHIDCAGRTLRIEYQWIDAALPSAPLLVFLHEGLGSLAMWRDFPQQLCAATGCRGLVYSRPGYGASSPRPALEQWAPDFMHVQAREVLPALLRALHVDSAPWLVGHSDGGSIALLFAAHSPQALAGAIVLAPHTFVEEVSITSIAQTREAYQRTDLRQKLARYHDDPDSAFWGWNNIWLAPAFRAWDIRPELASITCPLLAIQGVDDEYGTLEQVRSIARQVPDTTVLELPDCGHSAHRDQSAAVIEAVQALLVSNRSRTSPAVTG